MLLSPLGSVLGWCCVQKTHAEELEAERERGRVAAKEAAKGEREQAQVDSGWGSGGKWV